MSKVGGFCFVDGREVAETRQCVHCGRHWIWETGSGRKRGFCMNCMGITCGSEKCHPCIPLSKKIEAIEKGKHIDW